MNQYATRIGHLLHNQDGNYEQNDDGTYSQAIPLPFYGIRKHCVACSKRFWREESYRQHYLKAHTDGKRYNRTPTGLVEL